MTTQSADCKPTGEFAASGGWISAVEVHDPATKQSASWSGGTSKIKGDSRGFACIGLHESMDEANQAMIKLGVRLLFVRGSGASIYPAVQNMVLATRALGLGAWRAKAVAEARNHNGTTHVARDFAQGVAT